MDFLVDYVEELFQFFLGLSKEQLQGAVQDLKVMTPEPMNSMLVDKQPREEAIRKRAERLSMVTRDVPPTADPEGHSAEPGRASVMLHFLVKAILRQVLNEMNYIHTQMADGNNSYLLLYSQWQISQKGKAGSSLLELAHYVLLAKTP